MGYDRNYDLEDYDASWVKIGVIGVELRKI